MAAGVQRFSVKGLHGKKDFSIPIVDNTLVLVGENGSGKTTLLRMIFYFVSGRWRALLQFQFRSISAQIGNETFTVTRDDLLKISTHSDRRFWARFPQSLSRRIRDIIATGEVDKLAIEIERLSLRHHIPRSILQTEISDYLGDNSLLGTNTPETEIKRKSERIRASIGAQIVYLPTYRRIERELGSIFEDENADDWQRSRERHLSESNISYIELVEFGMRDVQAAVDRSLSSVKDFAQQTQSSLFLGYLSDVVDATYKDEKTTNLMELSPENIRSIVYRIDDAILSPSTKEHLFTEITTLRTEEDLGEREKIIIQYFTKILDFSRKLKQKEKSITDFCNLCSEYISDKKFIYNSSTFEFSISLKQDNTTTGSQKPKINLGDLSSGEKQIVSLFSHLYLSGEKKFFVLIDEPELSLSVPWQRRFLTDIRRGDFCGGVIAATHSPFIYDNALKNYAHSLGEFLVG